MKNKNTFSFREERLLAFAGNTPETGTSSPESLSESLASLPATEEILKAFEASFKEKPSTDSLKNPDNPYLKIYKHFTDKIDGKPLVSLIPADGGGGLILVDELSSEYPMPEDAFVALFWNHIGTEVAKEITVKSGKNITKEQLEEYLNGSNDDANPVEAVSLFYEAMISQPSLSLESGDASLAGSSDVFKAAGEAIANAKMDTAVDKAKKKAETKNKAAKEIVNLSTGNDLNTLKDATKASKEESKAKYVDGVKFPSIKDPSYKFVLDSWRISLGRDMKDINPHRWHPIDNENRSTMREEYVYLGIPASPGNPLFDAIFNQLRKCEKNSPGQKAACKDAYKDPDNPANWQLLTTHDKEFCKAWEWHKTIKDRVLIQQEEQANAEKGLAGLDSHVVVDKATSVIGKNLTKIQEAVQNRDYPTIAMYAVGIFAAYHILSKNKDAKILGFEVKDLFAWGAVAYVGNIMAKNAGYDLPKMLGIEKRFAEVKGTPLAPLLDIVPEAARSEENGGLDANVYLRASTINIADLAEAYYTTNQDKPKGSRPWIDPKKFPTEFPQFEDADPSDPEYVRVGEQLYLVFHYLRMAYNKTLMKEEGLTQYYNRPFETVLTEQPWQSSNVLHFTMTLIDYKATDKMKYAWFSEKMKQVNDRLSQTLPDGVPFHISHETAKSTEAVGHIAGFPVAIRQMDHGYEIFDLSEFRKSGGTINSSHALATIPYEGDGSVAGQKVFDQIEDRIKSHFAGMDSTTPAASGSGFEKVSKLIHWNTTSHRWEFNITIPADTDFGLPAHADLTVYLADPDYDRGELILKVADGKLDMTAADWPSRVETLRKAELKNEFLSSPHFAPLAFIEDDVHVISLDRSVPSFEVDVAGVRLTVYYKATNPDKYFCHPNEEVKLVQNYQFINKYVDGVTKSDEFDKSFRRLGASFENLDEQFLVHFADRFKGLVGSEFGKDSVGPTDDIAEGSVAESFGKTVLEIKKNALKNKLSYRIYMGASLDKVATAKRDVLNEAGRLDDLLEEVIKKDLDKKRKKEEWTSEEFMDVLDTIEIVGTSRTYSSAFQELQSDLMQIHGLKGMDPLSRKGRKLSVMMDTFTFYTSAIDSDDLDSAVFPMPSGLTDPDDLLPYQKIAYIRYVKDEMKTQGYEYLDTEPPVPGDWNILTFDQWLDSPNAGLKPLNDEDPKGALDNISPINKINGEPVTALQLELYKEIGKMLRDLETKGHGYFKTYPTGGFADTVLARWMAVDSTTGETQLQAYAKFIDGKSVGRRSLQLSAIEALVKDERLKLLRNESLWDKLSYWERLKLMFY